MFSVKSGSGSMAAGTGQWALAVVGDAAAIILLGKRFLIGKALGGVLNPDSPTCTLTFCSCSTCMYKGWLVTRYFQRLTDRTEYVYSYTVTMNMYIIRLYPEYGTRFAYICTSL